MLLLSSNGFFSLKIACSKILSDILSDCQTVLDPDFVGPDVGPSFLQRLSADDKSCRSKEYVNDLAKQYFN